MNILTSAVAFISVLGVAVSAQKTTQLKTGGGGSPHVRSEWTIDGANIKIEYGRPSLKGRVPGKDIDPYEGKPWRTGADEATLLTTDKPLKFGSVSLKPGTYTINTQPSGQSWQLILGRLDKPGQWGIPYPPSLELGRAPMTVGKPKAPVEQLVIAIDDTAAGGTLRVEWGTSSAAIPFTVG